MTTSDTHLCHKCGVVKPAAEFGRDRNRRSGLAKMCRECDRARSRAYYAAHRDERHAYYQATRERKRAYYQANGGRVRSRMAELHGAIRARAIEIYGGRCALCGSTGPWLEFDHPDNDGDQHRRVERHGAMLRRIVREGRPLTDWRLRLLCYTCHRPEAAAALERLIRKVVWLAPRVGLTDQQRAALEQVALLDVETGEGDRDQPAV